MTVPTTGMPAVPGAPAGAPPAAPAALTAAQLNMRVQHGDPNFPRELWGKTLADAMKYYAVMRQDFMERNRPADAPPPVAPAPTAAPAARPGYVPPVATPAPAAAPATFTLEDVNRIVNEAVSRAVAPIARSNAETVYNRMKAELSDWMTYNDAILESLNGASEEQLANPETWRTAYYFVKGRALSQPAAAVPAAPPPVGAPVWTPPPAPAGFVEGPSAPPPASNAALTADRRNNPTILAMARRFGISVDEYIAWMDGNVPAPGVPRG